MKIAVFSDLHGNVAALRTLLPRLQQAGLDGLYCLGDIFTPYPGSQEIWALLKSYNVQCVLGNNEAALLAWQAGAHDYTSNEVRFRPFLRNASEALPFLDEIRQIPATRTLDMGAGFSIHLCHYSPGEVFRGLHSKFDFEIASYVRGLSEPIVLTGHMHRFEAKDISGKVVYCVGSAGLPLKGAHQLEYILAEAANGEFHVTCCLLPYDFREEVDYLLRFKFLGEYGPIAWLAFDEILTQRDRLVPFIKDFLPSQPDPNPDYYALVEQFLRSLNRWDALKKYMPGNVR